jgi:hypothetical protein
MSWEMTATLVAVLAPLVGVPLSVMTLYLRAIREDQASRGRDAARRIETLEQQARGLEKVAEEVARDYTTKEEWLRESMLARQQLQRLTEMVARMQARLEDGEGLVAHLARAAEAMLELARRLAPVKASEQQGR